MLKLCNDLAVVLLARSILVADNPRINPPSLSFRQLMSASSDPVGDLAEHRYERLAAAMLKRAGLDPGRLAPPNLPELPAHRGS